MSPAPTNRITSIIETLPGGLKVVYERVDDPVTGLPAFMSGDGGFILEDEVAMWVGFYDTKETKFTASDEVSGIGRTLTCLLS